MTFEASPGGVPEVDATWLANHACDVRIVDVRESEEVEAGVIEGAMVVPLAELAEVASTWDPRDPVVLVCRSGRRSTRGVRTLESLGFTRVASLTGGMLTWSLTGLETTAPPPAPARHVVTPPSRFSARLDAQTLQDALRETPPRQVRAASLLLHGTEACVDGRGEDAVLGTPGGDAGELLLALAAVEEVTGEALAEGEVVMLFDAYVESFGRFYFHTDDHALHHLAGALRNDPRFEGLTLDGEALGALLSSPPPALRDPLLEHLLDPANVGCGHLRLLMTHAQDYGVRAELAHAFGRVVFRRLWSEPELFDFVVLHGDHHEEAVVNVLLPDRVHPFTNVPAIPPRIAGHSVFVNHPQVSAFVRRQHAEFLLTQLPSLAGVPLDRFEAEIERLAERQLAQTLGHLAAHLPVYELRFEDGVPHVTEALPVETAR
ncbi:MAG: rhodanese-like domain-containing protein [Sandaracinus sp.]|nr:rhodanese-like domain-containing protein [Sandaracinus sp.]